MHKSRRNGGFLFLKNQKAVVCLNSDFDVIVHFFKRLGEFPAWKIMAGIFLWILHALFGEAFRAAYGAIITLCLFDMITGYYHAWANPTIKPESRRLYHGLVKWAIYGILLIIGYQCSRIEFAAFIQGIIESSIIFTEAYSILENIQKIAVLHGAEIPILSGIMKIIQGKLDHLDGGPSNE
jgi:hypothetical protein